MKRFYPVWFFVCIGWGYLMAQPAPPGFFPPSSSAFTTLLAFPASAFWTFVLLAFEAWRTGPNRRLSPPSLTLKPWNMPTGVMLFVFITFLFASIWGLAFGTFLTSASIQDPVHFLALSSGGLAGLFLAPRILASKFMPSPSIEQRTSNVVRLGAVTDDKLFYELCDRIKALGGTIEDTEWDLGSSRQKTTYAIKVPGGELQAVADTEDGLFLQGEEKWISLLMQGSCPDPKAAAHVCQQR